MVSEDITEVMKGRTSLEEMQKILVKNGELMNNQTTVTLCENILGQALIDAGIQVIPQFKVDENVFDLKIFHYPILIEVDGGVHKDPNVRVKDYRKDRMAQRKGFKVLRFANGEVQYELHNAVEQIKATIAKCGQQPKEVWLYPLSPWEQLKRWYKEWRKKNETNPSKRQP